MKKETKFIFLCLYFFVSNLEAPLRLWFFSRAKKVPLVFFNTSYICIPQFEFEYKQS